MSLRDLLPSREGVQQIPLGLGFRRNKIVSIYISDKRRLLKKPVTHNLLNSWKKPHKAIKWQTRESRENTDCSQSYRSFEAMKNSTLKGCYPEHSNFLEWFGRIFRIWMRKITTVTHTDWHLLYARLCSRTEEVMVRQRRHPHEGRIIKPLYVPLGKESRCDPHGLDNLAKGQGGKRGLGLKRRWVPREEKLLRSVLVLKSIAS